MGGRLEAITSIQVRLRNKRNSLKGDDKQLLHWWPENHMDIYMKSSFELDSEKILLLNV